MNPDSTSSTSSTPNLPSQDEIALRAHQIWCEQGCPHGHDIDNWVEAERQLLSEYASRREQSIPAREDVPETLGESQFTPLRNEAPLSVKVDEQVITPGRPQSRQSPTSLDL